MQASSRIRFTTYLALSAVGLITALTFNGMAIVNGENYNTAWFGTAVDWVLSADLSVVAIAAVVFMFAEAKRENGAILAGLGVFVLLLASARFRKTLK